MGVIEFKTISATNSAVLPNNLKFSKEAKIEFILSIKLKVLVHKILPEVFED